MSARMPPVLSIESARNRLVEALAKMANRSVKTADDGIVSSPPEYSCSTALPPQIPTSIARVLTKLAQAGVPLHILLRAEAAQGSPTRLYMSQKETQAFKSQAVTSIVQAVDSGVISSEEFNVFLDNFAVPAEMLHKALADFSQNLDTDGIALNDQVYRLVSGRLVASTKPPNDDTSRLWLYTAGIVTAIVLLGVAVIRLS